MGKKESTYKNIIKVWRSKLVKNLNGKLQITPLKFRDDWILYPEVLEFRFYLLKFSDVWILHPDILEFGFYPLYFRSIWILLPKVLRCLDFTP